MKNHYHYAAIALGLALALPAAAATLINVGTSGTGSVKTTVHETVNGVTHTTTYDSNGANVSGSTGLDTSTNVGATIHSTPNSGKNTGPDINVTTGAQGNVGATTNTSNTGNQPAVNQDDSSAGTDTTGANASDDANASANAVIFNRSDFDASNQGALTTTMSAADVMTNTDLSNFAQSSMQSDENIDSMSFAPDAVVVAYKDHGRLIGFIPVTIDTNVTAHSDGTITVDYPWYSFLVSKDRDSLESDLNSNVGAAIRAETSAWTAQRMALVAERLSTVLRAHFNGSSMPTSSTDASTSSDASGSVTGSSTSATSNQ